MDYKRQQNRRYIQKILVFLVFGLFTAQAQAQIGILLPANISAQPLSTNVPNGDTAKFTVTANCIGSGGVIDSVTWLCNGKPIAGNPNVTTSSSGLLTTTVSSTLTINPVSASRLGTYTAQITDAVISLLGIITVEETATSQGAVLGNPVTVSSVTNGTGMVSSGFKLEYSGPTGSNLVIQATSDLSNWSSLSTNVIVNGTVTYTDTVARTVSCRFYRAKLQ